MWSITLAWLYVLYVAASPPDADVFALKLPELGDFLAGAFAPLAFAWLVYGYFMQASELRLQRRQLAAQHRELRLQRKALAASSKSLESQANSMATQITLLADQVDLARKQFNAGNAPDISVQHAGGTDATQRFTISNHGAATRDLQIVSWPNGWDALFDHRAPTRLGNGDKVLWAFTCTVPPADQFQFTIKYSVGVDTIEQCTYRWRAGTAVIRVE